MKATRWYNGKDRGVIILSGDRRLSFQVYEAEGGWYACADVARNRNELDGDNYISPLWSQTIPRGFGYSTKAEALKARTCLKRTAIEATA